MFLFIQVVCFFNVNAMILRDYIVEQMLMIQWLEVFVWAISVRLLRIMGPVYIENSVAVRLLLVLNAFNLTCYNFVSYKFYRIKVNILKYKTNINPSDSENLTGFDFRLFYEYD
jgi:hypothetical protein